MPNMMRPMFMPSEPGIGSDIENARGAGRLEGDPGSDRRQGRR